LEKLLSVSEASAVLGLTVQTVYAYVSRGVLPHVKTSPGRGGRTLFSPAALEKWIAEHSVEPVGKAAS